MNAINKRPGSTAVGECRFPSRPPRQGTANPALRPGMGGCQAVVVGNFPALSLPHVALHHVVDVPRGNADEDVAIVVKISGPKSVDPPRHVVQQSPDGKLYPGLWQKATHLSVPLLGGRWLSIFPSNVHP